MSGVRGVRRTRRHLQQGAPGGGDRIPHAAQGGGHRHAHPRVHPLPAPLRADLPGHGPGRRADLLGGGDGEGRLRGAPAGRPPAGRRRRARAARVPDHRRPRVVPPARAAVPRARDRRRRQGGGMRVTVLGSSGAYPAAGGAASGYLLEHDGFHVALDFGTGALANLQRHVATAELDAIVLSHEHMDHCLDLYPLFVARFFVAEPLPALPLWAPPGAFDHVAVLEDDEGQRQMREVYDVHEVEAGAEFEVGPFRFATRLLPHWVRNSGMRITADGSVLTYTGDTGPSDEIEAIA